ncbi:hypothetical protein [Halomonas sp. C22]|uniref:hypothetical protein n=1 Tax=Halomonas sp. C22 TaxID=2580567 RepID=UPI0021B2AF66|nr:hypothetical protein [Halomonas sp. C22]
MQSIFFKGGKVGISLHTIGADQYEFGFCDACLMQVAVSIDDRRCRRPKSLAEVTHARLHGVDKQHVRDENSEQCQRYTDKSN